MDYFRSFSNTFYRFGDERDAVVFQNISLYADVVDQVKDSITFLNVHTVQEGFRPDQVSIQLYGTPLHYWTFYLINDDLREQGWPLVRHELEEYTKKHFPNTTITTRDVIHDKFKIGQTVTGTSSGVTGKIIRRNLDLGQIIIEGFPGFPIGGEVFQSTNSSGTIEQITGVSATREYLGASHYIDGSGAIVDIDPQVGPGALITEKTHEEVYFDVNESLRQIKVIKPSQIANIVSSYKKSIKG